MLFIVLASLAIILFAPIIPISYTAKEPYERVETFYEEIPVEVAKHTEWNVTWYTLRGDYNWGTKLGTSKFPAIFSYAWGFGDVFKGYRDLVGFKATTIINVQKQGPVSFHIGGDDGCELYLNGSLFLMTGTYASWPYLNASTQTTLSPGKYALTLHYWEGGAGACVSFSADREVLEWKDIEYKSEAVQRTVVDYKYTTKTDSISILSYLLGQYPR